MKEYLNSLLSNKKVLILGYGREGRSTLKLLSEIIPTDHITVADKNSAVFNDDLIIKSLFPTLQSGKDYLKDIEKFDIVIKSPGISLDQNSNKSNVEAITSQTGLFLNFYKNQVIGITGTKGKSTTSSLLYHILRTNSSDVIFGGNIGIPLFDLIGEISSDTKIVCELSSHQLQNIQSSPGISILLNIFQEHLDHYDSYNAYKLAKYNIARFQQPEDFFIYNASDKQVSELVNYYPPNGEKLPLSFTDIDGNGIKVKGKEIILTTSKFSRKILPVNFQSQLTGEHNRNNAIVAAAAAALLDVPTAMIEEAISSFLPLEHRLEYVGTFRNVKYYNDSISTIPESAIAGIESLKPIDTLILGGFNRGIDYSELIEYLHKGNVHHVVTTGPAGLHIYELIMSSSIQLQAFHFDKFDEAVKKAVSLTPSGGICLLSPAASSYNEFKNFEERGRRFKELVNEQSS